MKKRSGGRILADQLKIQGVDKVFCIPGESYIDLLDGLYEHQETIQVITTRHEGGAANMADAHAKLTGRPGICMVTRGPGASNAAIGIHTAYQDSTPLILLIGQVSRKTLDREAFQEIDYRRMFGQMAKWVAQIDDTERIPEYISHAFHVATAGRPGPVVLALPRDMLGEEVSVEDSQRVHPVQASPSVSAIESLRTLLQSAHRPLVVVGGPTWNQDAIADLTQFVETNGLPVATSFRAQDCFDNRNSHYIGSLGLGMSPLLVERVKTSDLLIVVGPKMGELTTAEYQLLNIPNPVQQLIHIHPGAEELGRVYFPTLAINASMPAIAEALRLMNPVESGRWKDWLTEARDGYLKHIIPTQVPGDVNFGEIVAFLNKTLPDDAIITNGAGNYTAWVHRFFQHKQYRTQLAPTSGAMGYGVPAAIAAKLTEPEKVVVSFNGDGCFQIFIQELATAVQFDVQVVFIVVNNQMLGTIRMHQEKNYPTRVLATTLVNPDFVALAQAYGMYSERVQQTEDFPPAFQRALKSGKPALLELVIDPEALTPNQTLSEISKSV